jgi:hypothetical protein
VLGLRSRTDLGLLVGIRLVESNGVHVVRAGCPRRGCRQRGRGVGEQAAVSDPTPAWGGRLCVRVSGQRGAQ